MSPIQAYKNQLSARAEDLIKNGIPEKIVKLNELLNTSKYQSQNLSDVHQQLVEQDEPSPKRARLELSVTTAHAPIGDGTNTVPCNKFISDLIQLVKPHIKGLIEDSNLLKMWVTLLIPKIEDGDNFGVTLQQIALRTIKKVECAAVNYNKQMSDYFLSRGTVIVKAANNPHVDDYRRVIKEFDEKEYFALLLIMSQIRNHYCFLHDFIIKNLEKIMQPRSSNPTTFYK